MSAAAAVAAATAVPRPATVLVVVAAMPRDARSTLLAYTTDTTIIRPLRMTPPFSLRHVGSLSLARSLVARTLARASPSVYVQVEKAREREGEKKDTGDDGRRILYM